MTKAELIVGVSRAVEMTRKGSEVIVEPIFDSVVHALRGGERVEIRGFGSFGTHQRQPRVGLKPMLYFAAFKEHSSLSAASGAFFAALEDELRGNDLRKGTVHFPLTNPVPLKLIARIAKLRAAGITATAKKPLLGREKETGK